MSKEEGAKKEKEVLSYVQDTTHSGSEKFPLRMVMSLSDFIYRSDRVLVEN